MQDISSGKLPSDNSMRFANKRDAYIKSFQKKLLEFGKQNYLKLLFQNVKNLNQLNLDQAKIDELSNNIMNYIYQQFLNKVHHIHS